MATRKTVINFHNFQVKEVVARIQSVARKLVVFLERNLSEEFELKALSLRFTADNGFLLLYGLDGKSFETAENWKIIRSTFTPSFSLALRSSAVTIMPWLHYFIKIGYVNNNSTDSFPLCQFGFETIKPRQCIA